jgi:capsular polysaccharide biosynthesis protein
VDLDVGAADKPGQVLEESPDHWGDVLRVITKRLWFIMLITLIVAGLIVGIGLARPPIYEASVKMLVAKQPNSGPDTLSSEVQGLQQLTLTVIELINSRPVAEAVVRELDLQVPPGTLLESLSVEQVGATSVIKIAYEDSSPQRAQQVVNAIGDEVTNRSFEGDFVVQNISVSVWERAVLPEDPVSPGPLRNFGVGLGVGVMVGTALAFLLEHVKWRLKS